jgi:hypothetical protein
VTEESKLDVGPLGDRPVFDTGIARALKGFRTRLAAFGLGTPPSPLLAPPPATERRDCGQNLPEDR